MALIDAVRVSAGRGSREWAEYFARVADARAGLVEGAGPIVAGFSATTDALHRITEEAMTRLFRAVPSRSASLDAGLTTLRSWLKEGRDGELFIDDESAEPLLEAIVGPAERIQCGGTAVQAAWSWSQLGLRPLLALKNRTSRQLGVMPAGARIATAEGLVPAREAIARDGVVVPSNHVLEFGAGLSIPGSADGAKVTRSSRITVVLARKRLQLDEHFLRSASEHVDGGVGLVSGLNGLGAGRAEALPVVARVVEGWRDGGARLVHLELADYKRRDELAEVLAGIGSHVDSVGMNADELGRLVGGGDPAARAAEFAIATGLQRVVVHGDRWAMSVHRGDPDREQLALAAGSLAAANRALTGEPQAEWAVPASAEFSDEIPADARFGDWCASVVSTPYLSHPQSTIGLGDTFVSGDLLVQANPAR